MKTRYVVLAAVLAATPFIAERLFPGVIPGPPPSFWGPKHAARYTFIRSTKNAESLARRK